MANARFIAVHNAHRFFSLRANISERLSFWFQLRSILSSKPISQDGEGSSSVLQASVSSETVRTARGSSFHLRKDSMSARR